MLDQSNDDINSITAEALQAIIPHQFKISDQDIQKIADAVKDNSMTDITNLVLSHTQPLREEIDKLKYENRKLRDDLDSVVQYGRRSLIRISGIHEPEGERDTTDLVRKIISDIDPNYREEDVIRSDRVGKLRPL